MLDWEKSLQSGTCSPCRTTSKAPGTGLLDWPAIIPALRAVGFDGVLSLELGHGIPAEEQVARGNVPFAWQLIE